MLKMTDGTQDIQGMEYQPIPALNTTLTPGTKVILSNFHVGILLNLFVLKDTAFYFN